MSTDGFGNNNFEGSSVSGGGSGSSFQLNEVSTKYIRDCQNERQFLEPYPIAAKLIESEIVNVQNTGRISSRGEQYSDIYRQKTMKLSQKVFVPVNDFPKFNFVGKILGPGGNSLRRLQDETKCKICVLGRNSMRDRTKEEEFRNSGDPRFAHLNQPLHVEVSTIATPAEAYANIAYALAELRKYIIPDKFDEIRQEQLKELMDGPEGEKHRAKMEATAKRYEQQQQLQYPVKRDAGRDTPNNNNAETKSYYGPPGKQRFTQSTGSNYKGNGMNEIGLKLAAARFSKYK